ncbi:RING1 and YY1-binding protein B [Danaus plexippus]|uniref:Ring and YY1 binding protein n=1 Tax=Danaus plexippus plexippus TaxID=278856 RepID=A0A212EHI1_DANPL|nr:RING1 and YY1-binding protein B [Danaus plexippus]OWR40953.1 ring and YY1 binding protein [Danaus plexippus plexippus]
MDKKNAIRRGKRPSKVLEENYWDCSVCTYRNNAEAFKCSMCDVRKGTSTRKPRLNPALVAAQAAGTATSSQKRPRSASLKKKRRPPRLNNVDRSSAQTREVTVSGVTVVITEYKPKKSVTSSSSDMESSNDARP